MIFEKIISILDWVSKMFILLLAWLTTPLTFPIVYAFRNINWVRNHKPFWYWFDDEDGLYGAKYWREANSIESNTFWVAYRWSALRNPMWNLHASIKPRQGDESIISSVGSIIVNGEPSQTRVAALMYEDDEGRFMHNAGKHLSMSYSRLGSVFIWFNVKGRLYWRCSYAGRLFSKVWMELQLGVGKRYTFRFKVKINPSIAQ